MKRGRASTPAKAVVKRKPAGAPALKRPSAHRAASPPRRFLLRLVPGTYEREDYGDENDKDEQTRWPWTDDAGNSKPSQYDGIYEPMLELPSDCSHKAIYCEISNPDKQLVLVQSRSKSSSGKTCVSHWWSIEFPKRTGKDYSSLSCAHFTLSGAEPGSGTKVVSAAEHALLMKMPPLGRKRWHVLFDGIVTENDEVDVEVWLVDTDVPPGIPNACSAWGEYATRQTLQRRQAEVREENLRKQLAETRRGLLNARADRAALQALSPPALQMRLSPETEGRPAWESDEDTPELYVFLRTDSLINGRFVYSAPQVKSDVPQDTLQLYFAESGTAEDESGCGAWAIAHDTKIRKNLSDGTVDFCCASEALSPLGPHVEGEWGGWRRLVYHRLEVDFERMRDRNSSTEIPEDEEFSRWSFQMEALTLSAASG